MPAADVSYVPGDAEPAEGTQWLPEPRLGRVVEIRLVLVEPTRPRTLNLQPAFADSESMVSFVNGFRLASGEVFLVFARDEPLVGDRLKHLNRVRARERQSAATKNFDLGAELGPRVAVIEVEANDYRSIWDLSLARLRQA